MEKNTIKTVKELAELIAFSGEAIAFRTSADVLKKLESGNVEGLNMERTTQYLDKLLSDLSEMQRFAEQLKAAIAG